MDKGIEVISTFDLDQFETGESVDQCGPASVSLMHFAGAPGKPAQGDTAQAEAMMEDYYRLFIGPDVPDDHGGTSLPTLYKMIAEAGNHYQNLYPDGGVNGTDDINGKKQATLKQYIALWLEAGYPVIVAVTEDSVYDMELKRKPYNWNTTGLTHLFSITGVSSSGIDFLVRDTANVLAKGPRMYASYQLDIISATVVVPGRTMWLKRPMSTNPQDLNKAQPTQQTTLQAELSTIEVELTQLTASIKEVSNQIVS